MNIRLFFEAIIKYLLGVIIVGGLLFISAGSFSFWNAWLFMVILFIPMFVVGIILMIKDPELLKKRLSNKEKEKTQKTVILLSALMFVVGFILAGLSYRFNILVIPNTVVIVSSIVFLISYILYGEVLRENSGLYRTIKVDNNQELIDTGLYSIVRHPMYSITIVLFLMMPLILGSLISFIIFLIYPFLIIKRIMNEEVILEKELKGYIEYKNKVKYRLIPFIW